MPLNETHIKPQPEYPKTGNRGKFVRDMISSAYILKNGSSSDPGDPAGIGSFATQKAKAIKLSDYSFPVFIIRKPRQRSSYSKQVEGDLGRTPSVETDL